MKKVDIHEKYLGIPTIVGRSKKSVFTTLKDSIWKKLQGWKEKLLSRAGKEVLLKAVIQAIPTYLMGVYRIPIGVSDEIKSMTARFWWGDSRNGGRVHWKSWDLLCAPKCLGCLGFKDLAVFNTALLGKQAWRLLHALNSLFARVFKSKYNPNSDFLDSYLGRGGSYSWNSIWGSKSLLKEGLIWRVGNRTRIRVWDDPWVGDDRGRFLGILIS
ncbi:uncharacterized protein LOC110717604 [Chenopodium quinoa]|uniref:uncharacterized protein LOC110717604 n=1 Tax=Chenopodium quinoa TaxID=63459 RepID=UPI000B7956F3|nr:uncharacterized protein LOC110717604 [Chenopodium quinoa]